MANIKSVLLSATALSMMAGVAFAQSEEAYIDQTGDDNLATIVQIGTGNDVGDVTDQRRVQQTGDENTIDIEQSGDNSVVGAGGNFLQNNLGVDQTGNRNSLIIDQGNSVAVRTIQQDATDAGALPTATTNAITINQTTTGQFHNATISRVDQNYNGNGSTDAANVVMIDQVSSGSSMRVGGGSNNQSGGIFQTGFANSVDIDQTGRFHLIDILSQSGASNSAALLQSGVSQEVMSLSQDGASNDADITQSGNGNSVETIDQSGDQNVASVIQSDSGNTLTNLSQNGDFNDSTVDQSGTANSGSVSIDGDFNTTALLQDSIIFGNEADIDIGGDSNSNDVYVEQFGANDASIGIDGGSDSNAVAVNQLGANVANIDISNNSDRNSVDVNQFGIPTLFTPRDEASVNISGGATDNIVSVGQLGSGQSAEVTVEFGDGNELSSSQVGAANTLSIDVNRGTSTNFDRGDSNVVNATQLGFSNGMAVEISGSGNNSAAGSTTASTSPFFTGSALDLVLEVRGLDEIGGVLDVSSFRQGDLIQAGIGNELALNVSGNDNAYAVLQNGSDNIVDGDVSGSSNQAVVVQMTNGNNATFTQSGSFNVMSVQQGW